MVPIDTEQRIRKMIAVGHGYTDREIARAVGVKPGTVENIRETCDLSYAVDDATRDKVRSLLLDGVPVNAIEIRSHVPRRIVLAIRRFYFLHRRSVSGDKPRKCPTCGSVMFPDDCKLRKSVRLASCDLRPSLVDEACGIISDITDLYNLHLINNVLFHNLANRAERLTNKIGETEHGKEETA